MLANSLVLYLPKAGEPDVI